MSPCARCWSRPGELVIDRDVTMSIEELGERIRFRKRQRIVYFGSCSVLRGNARPIRTFLRRSGAKAVCGYTTGGEEHPGPARAR